MPFMKPYMVKLLREQFPPGTRIRLDSMMNDPQPIPKGMTGTVQGIDDAGQLLMEWDNGRGLSLVPGEDDFTVVKPQKLKLYMPLALGYYEKNDWGDYEDEELTLSDDDAVGYADTITGALERESKFLDTPRGFMEYYNRNDGVDAKVRSLFFKAEARNSKLWGVAECMVSGELNGEELAKLKDYIAGQASDGFGESVEQHEIRVGSMELYDVDAPKAFRQSTRLAQHTSFLKDVFRTYKDFTTAQIDTIEIMLTKLYTEWGITEETDFSQMRPEDYPILSELYDFIEIEYENFDETKPQLYTRETLQQILLGLHSMCRGADSKFFNGHTNLTSTRFLVFGVKGLLSVAQNVRSTILLNLLSYMSDKLLTEGNTVAALDELYIWLSNPVAIEYIRNSLKRVRKKESALVLASQNLEDFDQPGVREMTKPLFSIPPHQFLFNAGSIDRRAYMDMLQLEDSEFDLIKFPQRGVCLYKCGNERYNLMVHAPEYKEKLFGSAGGR